MGSADSELDLIHNCSGFYFQELNKMSATITASTPTNLPLPPPSTVHKDDPRAKLSESEQKMYDEVLAHFTKTEYALPNDKDGELREEEKFWLTRECILRFLRASKWKVATAIQRLEATLTWRREFGIYDVVNADLVEPEAVTGKEILFGYDKTGKPAFYMIPSRQNTTEATRQIQFAFWMVERSIDLMGPGVENLALLINFGDRGKNPSFSTAMAVLNILQNHYPERLGLALIINVPFLINAFFKMIMPFVDPITRQKVKFNPEIFKDEIFTTDNVMKEWGGNCNFAYEHQPYWAELNKTCEERSTKWKENWLKLGGTIGISEWAYKTYGIEKTVEAEATEDSSVASTEKAPAVDENASTTHSRDEAKVTHKHDGTAVESNQIPAPSGTVHNGIAVATLTGTGALDVSTSFDDSVAAAATSD